jgi:hypothetical protein
MEPAAEPLLLTLVKQALRFDAGDDSQDEYLNLLIATARESAETECSRGYIEQTITEYYDFFPGAHFPLAALDGMGDGVGLGYGLGYPYVGRRHRHRHDYLEFSRSPLKTLNSIKYKDPNGVEQTWPTDQYVVNDKQDPAQISRAPRVCWPRTLCEVNSVWAEYVVGYGADGTNIPAVVKQAMLLMISDWDANRLPVEVLSEAVDKLLRKNKVYYQP